MGWEFIEKHAAHDQFGSAFILVTSSINELWCADPFMAQSILARRKDFLSLPMTHKILGFLGGNVLTVSMITFDVVSVSERLERPGYLLWRSDVVV